MRALVVRALALTALVALPARVEATSRAARERPLVDDGAQFAKAAGKRAPKKKPETPAPPPDAAQPAAAPEAAPAAPESSTTTTTPSSDAPVTQPTTTTADDAAAPATPNAESPAPTTTPEGPASTTPTAAPAPTTSAAPAEAAPPTAAPKETASSTPSTTATDPGAANGTSPSTVPVPFVDQDGDALPTPVEHAFRQTNFVNGKVGTGLFFAHTWPFNGRTGYVNTFAEGDASGLFGTGLGLHWDVEVRGALSAFEARTDPQYITDPDGRRSTLTETREYIPPNSAPDTLPPYRFIDPYYRNTGTFVTGRTTDYLRIDRLALSYDVAFFGVDLGRSRIPEAALTVVDGLNLRFDFGVARFGAFAGLKPNPWHQQVVGAGSGGFVPVPLFGEGAPAEHVPVAWGSTNIDPSRGFSGETTGPYSNEIGGSLIGQGYPWTQLGSYRFQTFGLASALRFAPAFVDAALVVDTFYDPNTGISTATGELVNASDGFQLDRVWLSTAGGARIFDPLTVAWRGTLDVIGARPLFPRDVFLDATWRNLGPVTLSVSYFKINTLATAYSYARFFRPLENPSRLTLFDMMTGAERADYEQRGAITPETNAQLEARRTAFQAAGANINNNNLFVVDRDRVTATAAFFMGDSFQIFTDLVGERRNDFLYTVQNDIGASFQSYADGLTGIGDTLPNQITCSQAQNLDDYDPRDPTKATPPPGLLVGTNPSMPVWADRCKLGFTLGMRDPFLGRVGSFDLRFTQLFGYFSSTTRLSGRLGIMMGDRMSLDLASGFERNDNHRVYQPGVRRCTGGGFPDCQPIVITAPQNGPEAADTDFRFLPWPTNVYDLSAALTIRIVAGWFAELSYFGVLEEIPYMGDYFPIGGAGDPQRRDTVQYTQVVTVRTLYRF